MELRNLIKIFFYLDIKQSMVYKSYYREFIDEFAFSVLCTAHKKWLTTAEELASEDIPGAFK